MKFLQPYFVAKTYVQSSNDSRTQVRVHRHFCIIYIIFCNASYKLQKVINLHAIAHSGIVHLKF